MSKLHKRLHLQHHRHTGKLLHHRHTSYRGLTVVFVLAGLSMVGLNALAHASGQALINIYATAPVAVPTTPAVITAPDNGAQLTSAHTEVAGSCPLVSPQIVVALDIDGAPAGSSVCDGQNDFSLPITLASGSHQLLAHSLTITGGHGPDSDPLHLSYTVARPVSVAPAAEQWRTVPATPTARLTSSETLHPNTTSSTADSSRPLSLSAAAPFSYLGADRTVNWSGDLSGGQAPYHVIIDWGDGQQGEYNVASGQQQFNHHYGNLRSRNMVLYISDTSSHSLTEQFAVAAYTALPASGAATQSAEPPAGRDASTTAGLYGLFLTVVCICGIIWLEAKHSARAAEAPDYA